MTSTPAVIYARLSRNREAEQSASTKRQVDDCTRLARDLGLEVVAVEVDDDTSAYSGKPRPGYNAVIDLVESGQVGAVLAWHPDRLHRSPTELERFVEIVERTGVEVSTVQSGRIDLATPSGRLSARMLGNVARYESEHRSVRTKAGHDTIAKAGRWHGGTRHYGYEPVRLPGDSRHRLAVVPDEADVIREAAARVLAGELVGSVAADLNRRGITTVRGSRWSTPTLSTILTSPTIAGRRRHRGEDVGPADWPEIIDVETHTALVAHLARRRTRQRPALVALLTAGRCRCGKCGAPMRTARRSNGVRTYRCGGCYAMVAAEPLEALVTEALLQRLDAAPIPKAGKVKHGAIADLQRQLVDVAELFARGEVTQAEWIAVRDGIEVRLDEAQADAADALGSALVGLRGRGAVRKAWPDLPLDRRQAVLDIYMDAIRINPATRRGPGLDPNRVDITWRV